MHREVTIRTLNPCGDNRLPDVTIRQMPSRRNPPQTAPKGAHNPRIFLRDPFASSRHRGRCSLSQGPLSTIAPNLRISSPHSSPNLMLSQHIAHWGSPHREPAHLSLIHTWHLFSSFSLPPSSFPRLWRYTVQPATFHPFTDAVPCPASINFFMTTSTPPDYNRLNLNYRQPIPRPKVRGKVIDFHCHLLGVRHAPALVRGRRPLLHRRLHHHDATGRGDEPLPRLGPPSPFHRRARLAAGRRRPYRRLPPPP